MFSRYTVPLCKSLARKKVGAFYHRPICIRYNTNVTSSAASENIDETSTTKVNAAPLETKPLYEGPLAGITTRLKIISITTASGSMLGIPYLIMTHSGELGLMSQLAVGGVAMFGGTASTFLLNFFFAPYVHTLERIPVRACHAMVNENHEQKAAQEYFIKATTRNIFCRKVEIVFNPATDVSPYTGTRPFANFFVKNTALFVHGDLIFDFKLRNQLLPDMKDEDGAKELSDDVTDFDRDDDDEISPLRR